MQQQHLMPMMAASSYYPTTDHIQQYLDENKSLILRIVESQNSGKLSECAENQAKLQRNLMYLAAIADSQPHPPTMPSQYAAAAAAGGILLQQPQSLVPARSSMYYGPQPYPSLQQQQLGMSSRGGLMLLGEPHGGGLGFPDFMGGGSKQDQASGEGRSGSQHHGAETHYLKGGGDEGN